MPFLALHSNQQNKIQAKRYPHRTATSPVPSAAIVYAGAGSPPMWPHHGHPALDFFFSRDWSP
jgi:hypothetical protein